MNKLLLLFYLIIISAMCSHALYAQSQQREVLYQSEFNRIVNKNEWIVFDIDFQSNKITYENPAYSPSDKAIQAINAAPEWVKKDLWLKFREIDAESAKYADLIINSDASLRDEIAFSVAHIPAEDLLSNELLSDVMIIERNARFIYEKASMLNYVDIVEKGDYTTLSYKISSSPSGPDKSVEIPKEVYYWYLVHPKIHIELLSAMDNPDKANERNYGHFWRDYIWGNPSQEFDYTAVNKSSNEKSVNNIPVIAEMLSPAEYAWDGAEDTREFGRGFSSNSALDLIGNWISQALPEQVEKENGFTRNPNQILFSHSANSYEKAILTVAAARTALIPAVFAFEPRVKQYFSYVHFDELVFFNVHGFGFNSGEGFTTTRKGGGYEEIDPNHWQISMVSIFRPDGREIFHSEDFTPTVELLARLVDREGIPVDGVNFQWRATPGHPNIATDNAVEFCGQGWTNSNGRINTIAGDRKQYYLKIRHPEFGQFPASEEDAFEFISGQAQAGTVYSVGNIQLPLSLPGLDVQGNDAPENPELGIELDLEANELIYGVNNWSGRELALKYFDDDSAGTVTVFLCDEFNYQKFVTGTPFTAYNLDRSATGGKRLIIIPSELDSDGKNWKLVIANKNSHLNGRFVTGNFKLIRDPLLSVKEEGNLSLEIYPNPFINSVSVKSEFYAEFEIFNLNGQKVFEAEGAGFEWKPGNGTAKGVYILRAVIDGRAVSRKLILE